MNIESYKKVKNSFYEISLEGGEKLLLHEDLILKHELLIKKRIDKADKKLILEENYIYTAKDEALKILARKSVSSFEMIKHLEKKEFPGETIEQVIRALTKEKYLDDERYVNSYINDKTLLSSDGPYKIRKALQEKEIDDRLVEAKLSQYSDKFWEERIIKLQSKYLKGQRNKSSYAAKNKLYQYLSNLGYDKRMLLNTIDMSDFSEEDAKLKEYGKIKKKLSSKYEGDELERRIRQKLHEKGFI